mmetsp:Transcript_71159/g.157056  ORF Transcript_71159/g.157056 Transcript_71159/m.157056 type:complete len:102 (+) Transcript_71159:1742-2047(+)
MAKISFTGLFHFRKDHRGDLLWMKPFLHPLVEDFNERFIIFAAVRNHLERPELQVRLNDGVIKASPYEPLSIEDCVGWIACYLIFRCIPEQSLLLSPSNIR